MTSESLMIEIPGMKISVHMFPLHPSLNEMPKNYPQTVAKLIDK